MSKYEKNLVSVVIPTYRRSEMLTRAIESVLNQSYSNLELILVNDNNPDDEFTEDIKGKIKSYENDPRFHFIIQRKHINGAVARNVGIKQAKGEYLAFLDDDDWWEPNKIEEQVEAIKNLSEEYGVVSCRIKRWKNGKCFECSGLAQNGNVYKNILLLTDRYTTATLLFRRKDLDETGYFDEKLLRHQDMQLLVDFTYKYKIYVVNSYLHNTDISDASNRPNGDNLIKAKKAFFKSVNPIIKTLTPTELKNVKIMHNAEVGYIYLKNRQVFKSIPYFLGLFSSPMAFGYEVKKTKEKKEARKRADKLNTFEHGEEQ